MRLTRLASMVSDCPSCTIHSVGLSTIHRKSWYLWCLLSNVCRLYKGRYISRNITQWFFGFTPTLGKELKKSTKTIVPHIGQIKKWLQGGQNCAPHSCYINKRLNRINQPTHQHKHKSSYVFALYNNNFGHHTKRLQVHGISSFW